MSLDERIVRTHDLGLATALVSCGFTVKDIEQLVAGRAEFVFINTPELANTVNAYWANTLDVKARYFFDAIKMLKSRIYSRGQL